MWYTFWVFSNAEGVLREPKVASLLLIHTSDRILRALYHIRHIQGESDSSRSSSRLKYFVESTNIFTHIHVFVFVASDCSSNLEMKGIWKIFGAKYFKVVTILTNYFESRHYFSKWLICGLFSPFSSNSLAQIVLMLKNRQNLDH